MSDLKLFRTTPSGVAELPGWAMALDKSHARIIMSGRQACAFAGVRVVG